MVVVSIPNNLPPPVLSYCPVPANAEGNARPTPELARVGLVIIFACTANDDFEKSCIKDEGTLLPPNPFTCPDIVEPPPARYKSSIELSPTLITLFIPKVFISTFFPKLNALNPLPLIASKLIPPETDLKYSAPVKSLPNFFEAPAKYPTSVLPPTFNVFPILANSLAVLNVPPNCN